MAYLKLILFLFAVSFFLGSKAQSHQNTAPETSVISFLKWYKENEDRLHQIKLLSGGLSDTTTYYSVDYTGTERFIKELKQSSYLSDHFLNNLRRFFLESDRYLKRHPQNDGLPPGFEGDLIMKAQDYMDVWDNLENAKVVYKKIVTKKATIILLFAGNYKTKYMLTKIKGRWLIDTIDNQWMVNPGSGLRPGESEPCK